MNRDIITISETGVVNTPSGKIEMTDYEIANLLGVTCQSVKGAIKSLLKSRFVANCSGGIVSNNGIVIPEYFGVDVVIAVAFQFDSYECDVFRKWVIRNITADKNNIPIFITLDNNSRKNSNIYNN